MGSFVFGFIVKNPKYKENPNKILSIGLENLSRPPIIISGLPLASVVISTINLGVLQSNGHHAILGGLGVRRLPTQKFGFHLSSASHVSTSLWDRVEQAQNHLLLEAHPKSSFMELKIYAVGLRIPLRVCNISSSIIPLYFFFYIEKH